MRLAKTFSVMVFLTAVALIYIHMQMQIFDMAYQGKKKELQIMDLTGDNGMVAYEIMAMKSSNHLGLRLLSEKSELRFRDHDNIVQVVAATPAVQRDVSRPEPRVTHPLLSLLPLRAEAEARQVERNSLLSWRKN